MTKGQWTSLEEVRAWTVAGRKHREMCRIQKGLFQKRRRRFKTPTIWTLLTFFLKLPTFLASV